jgi:hypothetical protein
MTKRVIRKMTLVELGALPPDPRDFARTLPPRISLLIPPGRRTFGPAPANTVQAPQSALGLHPCIALSSAAANTSLGDRRKIAKSVIVVSREK